MLANVHGLRDHDAETLLRWRRALAASIGAVLREDITSVSEG